MILFPLFASYSLVTIGIAIDLCWLHMRNLQVCKHGVCLYRPKGTQVLRVWGYCMDLSRRYVDEMLDSNSPEG